MWNNEVMIGSLRTVFVLAAALACLAVGRDAGATTLRAMGLADLATEAAAVVIGTPVTVRTERNDRGRIVRYVDFAVSERISGETGDRILVLLLGGSLDGVTDLVSGEVDLAAGEEHLLFLERAPGAKSAYFVAGMAQGLFRIVSDPESGARFAARALGDVSLVGDVGASAIDLGGPCTSSFIPLDRLVAAIRSYAGR